MSRYIPCMLNSIWNRLFHERDRRLRSNSKTPGQMQSSERARDGEVQGVSKATQSVFIPLSSVGGDSLIDSIARLDSMLRTPAEAYDISLLGPEGLYPELALTIFELIKRRPSGTGSVA